jgi:hypothetical protein
MRDRRVLTLLVAVLSFVCHSSYAAADSISFSASFVDFGSVPVGTTSSAQSVTVTLSLDTNDTFIFFNQIVGAAAPFDSALASSPCSNSNLSCTYNFTFAPTAPVFSLGASTFVFVSADPRGRPLVQLGTVGLQGTGVGTVAVPGPIAGAGLPGLILASGGLLGWWRRRKKVA